MFYWVVTAHALAELQMSAIIGKVDCSHLHEICQGRLSVRMCSY